MCLNMIGTEVDTADKHYGVAFSCEGTVWSGELGDHQSALNIHAPETLLETSSDCWSKLGHGVDCTEHNLVLKARSVEAEASMGATHVASATTVAAAIAIAIFQQVL